MTVSVNGIAHIQLTVNDPQSCIPFWEKLCNFLEMKTLIRNDTTVYCIGSRTGILVRGAPAEKRDVAFDQDTAGLHHFCFRARSQEDVDRIYEFVTSELDARVIHGPETRGALCSGLLLDPCSRIPTVCGSSSTTSRAQGIWVAAGASVPAGGGPRTAMATMV